MANAHLDACGTVITLASPRLSASSYHCPHRREDVREDRWQLVYQKRQKAIHEPVQATQSGLLCEGWRGARRSEVLRLRPAGALYFLTAGSSEASTALCSVSRLSSSRIADIIARTTVHCRPESHCRYCTHYCMLGWLVRSLYAVRHDHLETQRRSV